MDDRDSRLRLARSLPFIAVLYKPRPGQCRSVASQLSLRARGGGGWRREARASVATNATGKIIDCVIAAVAMILTFRHTVTLWYADIIEP